MKSALNSLKTLNYSNHLVEINNLLNRDGVHSDITFWGTRVIKIKGNSGSIGLDELGWKVIDAASKRCNLDDLVPAERIAGVEIVRKLNQFYKNTDAQIRTKNIFTRFLLWIREFSFIPYTVRFYIEDFTAGQFLAYSEPKFLQQFGTTRSMCSFGPPPRIVANEKQVRNLLLAPASSQQTAG